MFGQLGSECPDVDAPERLVAFFDFVRRLRYDGRLIAYHDISDGGVLALPVGSSMEEAEREIIRRTLALTAGNKTRAAKILQISLKTMHNKVKKFGL